MRRLWGSLVLGGCVACGVSALRSLDRVAYAQGASSSDQHLTYTDPVSGGQALSQTFVTVQKV